MRMALAGSGIRAVGLRSTLGSRSGWIAAGAAGAGARRIGGSGRALAMPRGSIGERPVPGSADGQPPPRGSAAGESALRACLPPSRGGADSDGGSGSGSGVGCHQDSES